MTVAGDFQQDSCVYKALTSWPHERVAQLSLRHQLPFEPHLHFLLQSLVLQPAPTEQPPQHLFSLTEIWILGRLKLWSVWSRSEVHRLLTARVDSAPFSKTCSERFCTLSDTSEGVLFEYLFFFPLCCFAKFNYKSARSVLSSLSVLALRPLLALSHSLRVVFFGSQAVFSLGFFPRRWPAWCSLLWEWTVMDTAPALSLSLSLFVYSPLVCYLSATSGGEWNRSWFSCQHQALSLVHEGSWGTTVWTYHWNLY